VTRSSGSDRAISIDWIRADVRRLADAQKRVIAYDSVDFAGFFIGMSIAMNGAAIENGCYPPQESASFEPG
jgi:hypothetical protein